MKVISDLEVHSKYARAVSSRMDIKTIADWSLKKGIDLVGTGDFTHPLWFREIETNLEEAGGGIYQLKDEKNKTKFLLTSEVSCIYKDKGKVRRVHVLIFLPSIEKVRQFNKELVKRNCNLFSDGRPIVGLSLKTLAQVALDIDSEAMIIPAHVWTPWFGFYGKMGGYDFLEECYEEFSKFVIAIETGLSSDPAMNWRIGDLLNRSIVSFGDAHSPAKLGREATVFDLASVSYKNIYQALKNESKENKISYTIEFYPEEGKYHYTGHAKCDVVYSPNEARKKGLLCPVCKKSLTIGVMSRVEELAKIEIETKSEVDDFGVRWIKEKGNQRPGFVMMVPLLEIAAETLGVGVGAKKTNALYESLLEKFGSEFKILLQTPLEEIEKSFDTKLSSAIGKVRSGDIVIKPGFDGIFGKVKIWEKDEEKLKQNLNQPNLF